MKTRTFARLLLGASLLTQFGQSALAYQYQQFPAAVPYIEKHYPATVEQKNNTAPSTVTEPATQKANVAVPKVDGGITRAQFVKSIIDNMYGDKIPADCYVQLTPSVFRLLFSDVQKDASYGAHLCAAMLMGIIDGYPDITFRPSQPINYAEASKILTKAYGIATDSSDPTLTWYVPYVEAIRSHGGMPAGAKLSDSVTVEGMRTMLNSLR